MLLVRAKITPSAEPLLYANTSHVVRCVRIPRGPCSNADTDSAGLGWRFCIPSKLLSGANDPAPRTRLGIARSSHCPSLTPLHPAPCRTGWCPDGSRGPPRVPSHLSKDIHQAGPLLRVTLATFSIGGAEGR